MRVICANPACGKALAECCEDVLCWACRKKPAKPVDAWKRIAQRLRVWAKVAA